MGAGSDGKASRKAAFDLVVPEAAAGSRVDVFLSQHAAVGARSWAKELAQSGGVLVDGKVVKPGSIVVRGQRVTVDPSKLPTGDPGADPGPPPASLRVMFEDPQLVVIDKPAGISAHAPESSRGRGPNVADLAVRQFGPLSLAGGEDRPGIVHRLDKDTTGLMVLAKTDEAMHFLKSQFRARSVQKEYRAIVIGSPRFDSDWIDRNLAPHPLKGDRVTVVPEGGREAQTFYEVIERFAGFTYLRCAPKTGRTHQIRVHMTSIGHSLVGDRQYRARNAQQVELPPDAPTPGRHCLHAIRLEFEHPITRERLQFEAPLPEDMAGLLEWLRRERRG